MGEVAVAMTGILKGDLSGEAGPEGGSTLTTRTGVTSLRANTHGENKHKPETY